MSSPGQPLPKAAIIPRSPEDGEPSAWQRELADGFATPEALLGYLGLDAGPDGGRRDAAAAFPMRVPLSFARRMRMGDDRDPLLRQVLPSGREMQSAPGFHSDPVGDLAAVSGPGLLRKYHGRALLLTTSACAIHCRYCFRRHFPYADQGARPDRHDAAVEQIAADPSISEVILSGGDPLALGDARLARLLRQVSALPHVRRIRWHSRMPVVLPSRITRELIATLGDQPLPQVMVLHINHPNEINAEVIDAIGRLRPVVSAILNQAVLLRGVNDEVETLAALSTRAMDAGVLPYYLHLLDPVAGSEAFDVDERRAAELMSGLRTRLPGYLVPRLVRETPGHPFKRPIGI